MNCMAAPEALFIHGLFPFLVNDTSGKWLSPYLRGYGRNDEDAAGIPEQADYVASIIREQLQGRAHIAAHSVGGAIAIWLASAHPDLVRSLVIVEGNFTLRDAFFSAKLVQMDEAEIRRMLDSYRREPAAWLSTSGITSTPMREAVAQAAAGLSSARALKAIAQSVVKLTGEEAYLERVHRVIQSDIPIYLAAGERSVASWDVPDFVRQKARSMTVQRDVGHMMMLEEPAEFATILNRIIRE
jgi:pimeloyl-ACP methyl ester carboxylesterase